MLFDKPILVNNIIQLCAILKGHGVARVERGAHVKAIQPHLVGVNLFVPKPARFGSGVCLQLLAQRMNGSEITRIGSLLVQVKKKFTGIDQINIVFFQLIIQNLALLIHNGIGVLHHIIQVFFLPCALVQVLEGCHQEADFIIPFRCGVIFGGPGFFMTHHDGLRQAFRPRQAIRNQHCLAATSCFRCFIGSSAGKKEEAEQTAKEHGGVFHAIRL